MASKRPLRTTAYRGGKVVNHGRASTVHGAILSASRRLLMKRVAVVEIMDADERLLVTVRWTAIGIEACGNRRAFNRIEAERRLANRRK